jgi:predicted Rossmann fold nucleotide-binding protein DprA/Smf involved in DNA uptake
MSKLKVAVVGSRTFKDFKLLEETLSSAIEAMKQNAKSVDCIISGGANGADELAEKFAENNKYDLSVFLPQWSKFRRGAGPARNQEIADACDHLYAFWDGKSRGTKDVIDRVKRLDKYVKVIRY